VSAARPLPVDDYDDGIGGYADDRAEAAYREPAGARVRAGGARVAAGRVGTAGDRVGTAGDRVGTAGDRTGMAGEPVGAGGERAGTAAPSRPHRPSRPPARRAPAARPPREPRPPAEARPAAYTDLEPGQDDLGGSPGADLDGPSPTEAAPAGRPAAADDADREFLTVVRGRPRRRAARAPFVLLLMFLLGAGLLCLLLLNTALAQNSFQQHALTRSSNELADTEQALSLRLDQLSDPTQLAQRAAQLGMVPGGLPTVLVPGAPLPPGARVIGRDPASGATLVIVPAPPAPPAAKPATPKPGASAPAAPRPSAGASSASAAAAAGTSASGTSASGTSASGTSASGTSAAGASASGGTASGGSAGGPSAPPGGTR